MKPTLYLFFAAAVLLSSCVTKKEFQEMEDLKTFYEQEAQTTDSLKNEYNKLAEEKRQLEIEVRNTRIELEEYVVANQSINKSYQNVLDRLEGTIRERNELDETASYEKLNLEQQLAKQQGAIDNSRDRLQGLEYELYQKDGRLTAMEYDYSSMSGTVQDQRARIVELERMVDAKGESMKDVRRDLGDLTSKFSSRGLSVEERGGKLYLSLSSNLLFPSGSTRIDTEGRDALRQLAAALKDNPDIDILVEGHTDADGSAALNWKLSVERAVSVTQVLSQFGIKPERMTAAGRGEHVPVASNQTVAGKAQNRRTEIVISPKLDEVYEFLSN